jgi:hypothetical protein
VALPPRKKDRVRPLHIPVCWSSQADPRPEIHPLTHKGRLDNGSTYGMWKVPLVRDNGIWERGCHGPYVGSSSGTRDSWPRPTPFCYCISWWLLLNSYSLTIGGFMTYRHLSALNIGYAGDCWRARGNLTTEVTCGDTTFCATGLMEMKRMSTCLGIGASYCNWRYTLQRRFHWDVIYQLSRSSRSCRKCYRAVIHLSYLLPFHSLIIKCLLSAMNKWRITRYTLD